MPASSDILVSTDWLAAHTGDPGLRLFDCTVNVVLGDGGATYLSGRPLYDAAHIPGAAFADLTAALNHHDGERHWFTLPSAEDFSAAAGALGIGDGTTVVLYDQAQAAWASRLWWQLRANGFAARVLDGGFSKWQAEGRPVTTAAAAFPAAKLTPRPRPELVARREDVVSATAGAGARLVNTLAPESYRGVAPLHAGRPGHIPTSVNVPYATVLDPATNAYLPPAALRELFERELGSAVGAAPIITYCNAGVAATSAALALALAGVEDVAVYDGSLREWAADPALPLVIEG